MQDKYYLVGIAQLPNSASLDRTDAVVKQMSKIALAEPGVESVVAFPGLSINGFVNVPNAAVMFVMLDPFKDAPRPIWPRQPSLVGCRRSSPTFPMVSSAYFRHRPSPVSAPPADSRCRWKIAAARGLSLWLSTRGS
ncbi:hypothetical protein AK51_25120 [Serratia nematodiphila DZ0503SBS1]|nr:hypothetical protein AK51_25120 [Serratia nematodiphila DZ0503SBS1]